jgi:hypothetical protein
VSSGPAWEWRRQLPAGDLPVRAEEFANTAAARAADDAVNALRARRDELAVNIEKQRGGLTVPTDDMAAQVAAQRWFQRTKPVWDRLDSGQLAAAVRDAVAAADAHTLAAIAEDTGPYLQSRGLNPAVILEPPIQAKLPGLSQSTADLANFDKALVIAEINQRQLHHAYNRGTVPPPPVSAANYDPDAS